MRRLEAASFSRQWKRKLGWRKGTRVVVLFENRWDWERLSETFREKFVWYYDVLYLEIDTSGERLCQLPESLQNYQKLLCEMQPEGLVGIGGFSFLQMILLLRERLAGEKHGEGRQEKESQTEFGSVDRGTGKGRIPILLFSGRDRWQAFFRETLWIRGEDGRTKYWGYVEGHKKDALVMTIDGEFRDILLDEFDRETSRLRNAMAEYDICEELAEPLRIRYGIPVDMGVYFALHYLYRQLTERERADTDRKLGGTGQRADWRLERLAHQYRQNEMTGRILPKRDVPLLTEMAMEGIENTLSELSMRISWDMVEGFYQESVRSISKPVFDALASKRR